MYKSRKIGLFAYSRECSTSSFAKKKPVALTKIARKYDWQNAPRVTTLFTKPIARLLPLTSCVILEWLLKDATQIRATVCVTETLNKWCSFNYALLDI